MNQVLEYTAFSDDPAGGNPAGVVLDARGLDAEAMLAIAARLGHSETAFLAPRDDGGFDIRYFSPRAEVSFCGHATIAASVALGERRGAGELALHAGVGLVRVQVRAGPPWMATLTSVAPRVTTLAKADLAALLEALRWDADDLDPSLAPALAYAGAWHPVIVVRTRARLAALDYDFDALAALMAARGWTTVDLAWRESPSVFHARNPFPPGGVVEDPATGAAAAAFGAYLGARDALPSSRRFTIHQGADLGRPSVLHVHVPAGDGAGVEVSGTAVALTAASAPRRPA